jgi:hypothetical protein
VRCRNGREAARLDRATWRWQTQPRRQVTSRLLHGRPRWRCSWRPVGRKR